MNQFDYQRALFASSELTANDILTACVIGSHYNWKTKEASFPSNKTIAKESHLSIRSVIRAKNNLVSHGYLVTHRRYDMSNMYIPSVPQSHEGCPSGNLKDTLIDTLKDNLKDNKKDSNESFDTDIIDLNQGKISLDTIWKVFEKDERNDAAPAQPIVRNRQDKAGHRGINRSPGRNNSTDAEESGIDQILDQATRW